MLVSRIPRAATVVPKPKTGRMGKGAIGRRVVEGISAIPHVADARHTAWPGAADIGLSGVPTGGARSAILDLLVSFFMSVAVPNAR